MLQAADLFIRGSPRDHFFNCARAGTFSQAFETAPCQVKLAKAIKVLGRRDVTDQCSSVVAGQLQARPILIQAQATLISLPSKPHRGENNTLARGDYAHFSPLSRCRVQCRLKLRATVVCSNSLFPKRKLLEDSFDEREGKSYT